MVVVDLNVNCLANDGLQGQQHVARGNTLGNNWKMCNPPCMGKSFQFICAFALARTSP